MEPKFPDVEVEITGHDSNVYAIIGRVSRALKDAGECKGAKEFVDAARASKSYDDVLQLCMRTVDVS